ncbi:hypothetical protein BCR34DRAFT_598392 [Clohesyomyces aquaticus]|uniref:Uncharacterized protein n=1 Tax=Clohesyomyces aquaticus TaxID=1231657 RepID=A0A1Y1ZYW7_9PLEO|nr:hypothetical protein BCR34DRAFT_598392 [Clohesyomyces aquaticus]
MIKPPKNTLVSHLPDTNSPANKTLLGGHNLGEFKCKAQQLVRCANPFGREAIYCEYRLSKTPANSSPHSGIFFPHDAIYAVHADRPVSRVYQARQAQPKKPWNIEDLAEQLGDAKVDHKKDPAMEDLSQALNKKRSPNTTDTKAGALESKMDWKANPQR